MIKKIAALAALATALLVAAPGPAFAHSQTVVPPGFDSPVVSGPISQPWAEAHCRSAAPSVVARASGGVVSFSPPYGIC